MDNNPTVNGTKREPSLIHVIANELFKLLNENNMLNEKGRRLVKDHWERHIRKGPGR